MVSPGLLQTVEEPAPEVVSALPAWLQFPGYRIVAALIVVALGLSLSNLLVRVLGRPIARRFERQSVAQTVLGGVRGVTVIVTLVVAGSLVGLQLSNIVLSVTVFSAVVGIILAPIVGNVLNGVFVLADQPYEIGDMIELDEGTRGFVDDITIRYTKIFTLNNTFLVIPNGNIRQRDVTNYSAEDERTRLSLDVLVTYESDISEARRLMEAAGKDTENVIKGGPDIRVGSARYPAAPRCYIADYGDNGILLRLRFWATKPYNILTVESGVRTQVRKRFIDADATVEMAYPHRQLVFDETSEAKLAVGETNGQAAAADTDSPTDQGVPTDYDTAGDYDTVGESPSATDAAEETRE